MAFLGLYALQHRGEEAAGIVSYDGKEMHVIKKDGLAVDNFDESNISQIKRPYGHRAYPVFHHRQLRIPKISSLF